MRLCKRGEGVTGGKNSFPMLAHKRPAAFCRRKKAELRKRRGFKRGKQRSISFVEGLILHQMIISGKAGGKRGTSCF